MAYRLKMALIEAIVSLKARGWSNRRIARELGVDRDTVSRQLRSNAAKAPIGVSVTVRPSPFLSDRLSSRHGFACSMSWRCASWPTVLNAITAQVSVRRVPLAAVQVSASAQMPPVRGASNAAILGGRIRGITSPAGTGGI